MKLNCPGCNVSLSRNKEGYRVMVYLPEEEVYPELMYMMAHCIVTTKEELMHQLGKWDDE